MKNCTHRDCVQINPQPFSNFNKHPQMNDGYGSNCKMCQRRLNKASTKKWKKNNPGKAASYQMKRYAAKLQRTPKWLTEEQLKEIQQFYMNAEYLTNYTKIKFEVDHIIPLQGENISGLHVPSNLQLITAEENVRKHNKW